jgi:beta-galactosidase
MGKTFLLGSDHYYNLGPDWPQNNPTPQYALNAFTSLEMLRLMGYPPVVFEIPSGSASDWPPVLPQDARACYMANLAFGMKGHNYYIFTGGPNPPGLGATTDLYDYGAPVGAAGEIRPLYQAQKEFHAFLQKYSWLPQSARESDCRFGLDFDAVRSHHFWKNRGPYPLTGPEAWDFLRRGALTSVMCAGMSPVFVDLGAEGFQRDASSPLVVIASPVMSAAKQMRITEFLRNGGKVLLAPVVPVSDERFNPCTILSEFLGKPDIAASQAAHSRVGFDGIPNVSKAEVFVTRSLPRGAECLAVDEASKKPVAWRLKTEGNGEVIFLGLRWSHGQKEQARMMKVLLDRLGLRQKVTASNPNVWTSVRRAGDRTLLFALNLYSSPQEPEIQYRPDGIGKPKVSQKVKLNAMEVKAVEIR